MSAALCFIVSTKEKLSKNMDSIQTDLSFPMSLQLQRTNKKFKQQVTTLNKQQQRRPHAYTRAHTCTRNQTNDKNKANHSDARARAHTQIYVKYVTIDP